MIRALIPLPVAVPMIVAAAISATTQFLPRWIASAVFTVTAVFETWCTAMLLLNSVHQPLVYWFGDWWPRGTVAIGECFVIAPLPAALAMLVSILMLFASIVSWQLKPAGTHLEPLMLLFMAAMCGFAYSGDLFNLFVWFELMSAAAFALCALKTVEPAPLQGGFNFAITNTVGAFFILTGLSLIYARTGALNMAQIGFSLGRHADALVLMSFLLMTVGYMVKGALVPFHLWLADAHAVAPTPVCMIFSGVMVELGIYAVARIYWSIFQAPLAVHTAHLRAIYIVLGTVTTIVGGLMCFAQHHLKRLLAYSTVCHAGLMMIAVGLFDSTAMGGFLLYVVGHGLLKGGLFALAGVVLHRLGFIGEPTLHGRGRGMAWTPLLFIIGAIGLTAAPGFLLEAAESAVARAGIIEQFHWVRWVYLYGGAVTGAAVLRFTLRIFFGWGEPAPLDEASRVDEKQETLQQGRDVPLTLFGPAACLIALAIATAFMHSLPQQADVAARLFTSQGAYISNVLNGRTIAMPPLTPLPSGTGSMLRGTISALLAVVITLISVLSGRTRWAGVLGWAERGIPILREWQSGHPGDYVLWITVGTVTLGGCFALYLR